VPARDHGSAREDSKAAVLAFLGGGGANSKSGAWQRKENMD